MEEEVWSTCLVLQVVAPPPKVGRLQGLFSKLRRGSSREEEDLDLSRPASIAGPRPVDSQAELVSATKSGQSMNWTDMFGTLYCVNPNHATKKVSLVPAIGSVSSSTFTASTRLAQSKLTAVSGGERYFEHTCLL